MSDYRTFLDDIQKRCQKKNFKISGSFGVYDAYRKIRKHQWYDIGRPLKEKEFYAIVRGINNMFAEEISNGNTVTFPERMGKLELRKKQCGASLVNGKLKVTYPIDWSNTLKLWFEDEEAKNEKVLLRQKEDHVYRVKYCKYDANYENKSFYEFALNRFIKKALKDKIKKGLTDTLW